MWFGKGAPYGRDRLVSHAALYNTFNVQRHPICRRTHRQFRAEAHNVWGHATVATARVENSMVLAGPHWVIQFAC